MSEDTIFTTCAKSYDAQTDLTGLLQCLSETQELAADAQAQSVADGLDSFYLIFAGALVFFMQTGFAMLCAGSIRAKNVKNVLLWNLLDSCGGGIAFWICGFAFAYGGEDKGGAKTFVGNTNFFLMGDDIDYKTFFFQFTFACALSSIVAGTIAERTKMTAYLYYSAFLVGFVYPVVAHAFWSVNGFLSNITASPLFGAGAIDLAGSGPVHMTGGVCALAAGIILGPRLGRFHDSDGNVLETPGEFPPHSVSLQFLGTFALWFGWYGFNPGSVLMISSTQLGNVAELVTVNTTLGACAGALSALFFSTWWDSYLTGVATYDAGYTMNGCLTGLVAITAGCATVEPWAAVVIGVVAGIVYLVGSKLLIHLRIDDAVDAIPVHLVGGAWGLISTGLFSNPDRMMDAFGIDKHVGWFYSFARGSGDFTLLGVQLIGVLFIFAWTFTIMGVFFLGLSYLGLLRIDPLEEEVGMDISRHKGSAYDMIVAHPDLVDKLNISRSGSKKGKVMGAIKTKEEEDAAATIEGPLEPAVEATA